MINGLKCGCFKERANLGDAHFHFLTVQKGDNKRILPSNEVNQTAKTHDFLNRVRESVFNSTDYNYSGLSKEDFRTVVW